MNLTKEHIQIIDNYLKKRGISYWDIRLEMTDHIACKMESKNGSYDFPSLFAHTLDQLGWSSDLKAYQDRKLRVINTSSRRRYFSNFIGLFTSFKNLGFVFVFIIAYYLIFQNFSNKFFSLISFTLFGLPIIGFTIHYAYMSLKFKKSAYLFYGYFYIIFSMLLSNILYQFPKPDGIIEVTMVTRQNIIFFTTIFNVLFIISGIKLYMNTAKQYSRLEQKLF